MYEKPEMKVIEFVMEDVITGSTELESGGQMGDGDSVDADKSGIF